MRQPFNLRRHWLQAAGISALLMAGWPVQAQNYPDKPVRIVVGGPAGGAADVTARLLAEKMSPILGQPILVDNKPGAGGLLGIQELLKSPRDGYTLMVNISGVVSEVPHAIKVPFDPFKVLQPQVEMARGGLVLVTNTQTGAQNLDGFIKYVKANKDKISFASYSAGTVSHTLGLELNKVAGLDMVHVGYKGSPPALQDLIGGSVQAMFDGSGNVLPHVRSGKLKALAVTSPQRMSLFPDVPTFTELGYKDLTEIVSLMLFSTPDVPAPVQAKVREAAMKALQDPKLRETFNNLGLAMGTAATPDELMAGLRAASDKQGAMLKSVGFKIE
ncbi:Bug family tripartite tricarboxylate transporter substrate binding protein [Limnohabitans radicicola]|uniref:Tripartite tricarboxylate transporter substrate binding protein n=1 Tax=Limnohabitans radicicola TaxID=2771427 RepID=A0A927FDX0_9BURK|nr:tripartite tricarboxylate transporter substrate binding protein [Limnohabitans radicicola]MBD8049605.1 tripartite tricarboxylate transporter substrate binding protein [Limnohabitans radicicola]